MTATGRATEIVRSCLDPEGGDLYISHLGDHRAIDLIKKIAEALRTTALPAGERQT